jgi:AI-2 transport protein TqsA
MAIKTAASVVTAVLIGLWLRIFEVPYLPLWMLLAFLLNFIPNIGSIIAAIPAVLIAWLELGTMPAVGCAVGYIVVNVVIGNFLEPRFMGRHLGLSPLVIFCSMMFWGWVLGPIGMLLSIPLTMTVHLVLNGFDDTRWIATLMGGQARDA